MDLYNNNNATYKHRVNLAWLNIISYKLDSVERNLDGPIEAIRVVQQAKERAEWRKRV